MYISTRLFRRLIPLFILTDLLNDQDLGNDFNTDFFDANFIYFLVPGGWNFGTQKFKDMCSTRYTRQTFIYSAIPFLRDRHFDGLDMDWEYPKGTDDKKNFVLLLKGRRKHIFILNYLNVI